MRISRTIEQDERLLRFGKRGEERRRVAILRVTRWRIQDLRQLFQLVIALPLRAGIAAIYGF